MADLHVENDFGKLVLPPFGSGLCWRLLSEGKVWERETIEFIYRNLEGGSIITAGTYVGDFLPGIHKNARWVYGFEPDIVGFEYCRKNIALNGIQNASCENVALSSTVGHASLVTSGGPNAWARSYQPGDTAMGEKSFLTDMPTESTVTVETITVDEIVFGRVITDLSILHLDVEGHERDVVMGALRTIATYEPIVVVEEGTIISDILPSEYKMADFTVGHDYITNGHKLRFQNMIYYSRKRGGLT